MTALLRGWAASSRAALAGVAMLLVASTAQANPPPYSIADLGNTYRINGYLGKVLNDGGEVIGNEIGDTGQPFLYSNGSWAPLGRLNTSGAGTTGTVALGLNNLGLVVGDRKSVV